MKVSVYCTVYNHEKYLRSALEGFVSQITDFEYEVIVHDDASTDHSAELIREYEKKHPAIIKPIYQKENQYSKQVGIFQTFIRPKMKGEYIAACEGDDYWCDPYKLQKQVDFLDSHPEYTACVHNTRVLNVLNNKTSNMFDVDQDMDVTFEMALESKSYHTSSLMYRAKYADIRPDFFRRAKTFGDAPMAILLTWNGKVRFLKDVMSVYRHGTQNSWSMRNELDMARRAQSYWYYADMLRGVNEYTQFARKDLVEYWTWFYELNALSFEGKKGEIKKEPYSTVFRGLSLRKRLPIYLRLYGKPLYIMRNNAKRMLLNLRGK